MRILLKVMLFCLFAVGAVAQTVVPPDRAERDKLARRMDMGRVGIVTGGPGGTYLRLGADLQRLVEAARGDDLRVVVSLGRGSVGNLQDLVLLKYTDFALVQADVLSFLATTSPKEYDFLKHEIAYVAAFHREIIHIVGRGGPFQGPGDLAGKRIAVGGKGSGTAITAPIVLRQLLQIDFDPVEMGEAAALNDLLSDTPSIDAFVYVAGRGSSLFTTLSPEARVRIAERKIYFVPLPQAPDKTSPYTANSLTDRDYPDLIPAGDSVPVWSIPAVLAVYDWNKAGSPTEADRYRRVDAFVSTFFDQRAKLNDGPGGYNENWCDVDLGRPVEGWKRFRAVDDWLMRNPGVTTTICPATRPAPADAATCPSFRAAMQRANVPLDDPALSKALFLKWLNANPGQC